MRAVRLIGTIGFLLCLGAGDNVISSSRSTPTQQIVPLYASGPRARVMLTLGDGPPTPVLFDTGTDGNSLTEAYAKHLRLKVIGSTTMIDAATGKSSRVPIVALPRPRISGVPVSPAKATRETYAEPDMVGIFGPGSFSGSLVTLELSRDHIRVSPMSSGDLPSGIPTPYRHGLPALNIDVAGIPVNAHLDSGSNGGLSLGKGLMTKVKLKAPPVIAGQAISALGTQDIYGGQIDGDVTIGPLVLHDPAVVFLGNGEGGNIGYDILRKLVLVMDSKGQRSWVLDPADLKGPLDQFAGQFGPRTIRVENGKLIHQREGRPPFELKYLGGDLFEMPATGDELQFHRTDGKVTSLEFIWSDGQVASANRTS